MKIKLKPCPFCGGNACLVRRSRSIGGASSTILDSWCVRCNTCEAETHTYKSKIYQNDDGNIVVESNGAEAAALTWNRREGEESEPLQKAIAVDFDGCICSDAYPDIGVPNWTVIDRLRAEQAAGAGLILWTCREGALLSKAFAACKEWGLHFDAVNENLPSWIARWGNDPRKVGATEYWDDRAIRMPEPPND